MGAGEMLRLWNMRRNKRFSENPLPQFLIFKAFDKAKNPVKLRIVAHDNLDH